MNRHLFFKILTVWFLLTQCFPPYFYYIRMGGALCLAVFVGAGFILFPNLLSRKSIMAMLLYGIVMFFYFWAGNAFFQSISMVVIPFLSMISALLMIEYVMEYDYDYSFTKLILYEVVALNVTMSLISIPQLIINPNIIRGASTSGIDRSDQQVYYWIVSYATIHGLPFLMAPLVFFCRKIKSNRKTFLLWLCFATVLYLIIFLSNATTAFILATLMVVAGFLFVFESFNRRNIFKIISVGILAFALSTPIVIIPILDAVQSVLNPRADNYSKIDEMKSKIIYGDYEGDYEIRQDLYKTSKSLFWESPFLGTDKPQLISNHTFIWDRLALYGIFMIIPLVLVFKLNIKSVYRNLRHTKVTYVLGVFGFLFLLYMKNEFGSGTWLYGFAILPVLCRYIDFVLDYPDNKKQKEGYGYKCFV